MTVKLIPYENRRPPSVPRRGRLVLLLLLLMLIPLGTCLAEDGEQTVYVTHSGGRYHREHCSSLRNSRIAVSLAEAVRSGYEPCSRCGPPALSGAAAAFVPPE
jgi:hypothetical protein